MLKLCKGLAFGSLFLLPTLPNASILQDLVRNNDDGMVCFRQGFGGRPAFAKASAGGVGLATLILERGRCSNFAKVSPSARFFYCRPFRMQAFFRIWLEIMLTGWFDFIKASADGQPSPRLRQAE
jgi:hypothetical protein